jgi:hypothetical protein
MMENYYLKNKSKLMSQYRFGIRIQKKALYAHYDRETADRWLAEAEKGFEKLLPGLPDIGGDGNIMLKFLLYTSYVLPIANILKREGAGTRQIGEILFEMSEAAYKKIPGFLRGKLRRDYTSPRAMEQWRARALDSQQRKYPGDWVVKFIEGDADHLFQLEISECALVKFWRDKGMEELVPYLCLADWANWRIMGVNAARTMTLANGAPACDYRYMRGPRCKDCPGGWPPESMKEWTGIHEGGNIKKGEKENA